MIIPSLKRIKISSERELKGWLGKQPDHCQTVMLVTNSKRSSDNFVSREQVHDALVEHGWTAGTRYTLNGNLLGHVISRECIHAV